MVYVWCSTKVSHDDVKTAENYGASFQWALQRRPFFPRKCEDGTPYKHKLKIVKNKYFFNIILQYKTKLQNLTKWIK